MSGAGFDAEIMRRALDLAARGKGFVEPNPMVGCVLVQSGRIVGQGWHRKFGGPHAEIEAIRDAGDQAAGATMYVTLEPCCHHGKTPPCSQAVIDAGIRRVVISQIDPYPQVDGGGSRHLQSSGIEVDVGLLELESRTLNAPYFKLLETGRPWVIAKWAMTLDGKIASCRGDSQWISGPKSRQLVHRLRGQVDGIVVGRGTAITDDPMLTARPAGPRVAARIVVDSSASIGPSSQLVKTATETPVLIATAADISLQKRMQLENAGCELLLGQSADPNERLLELLDELGKRRMTNLLVEGGGQLLGSLFDLGQIDEVHVFVAGALIGGRDALSPIGGMGIRKMDDARRLGDPVIQVLDGDVHIRGRLA